MRAGKWLTWCFLCPVVTLCSRSATSSEASNGTFRETVYEYMARTLPQLCPYEPLCYRNATRTASGTMGSCCTPCSCREHCHLLGNCCPDLRPPPREPPAEASLTADMFQCICQSSWNSPGAINFNMVSKCPEKSSVLSSMKSKCENPTLEDLNAVTPISNAETGIIYRNSYCSSCHNTTGIPWTVSLECPHQFHVAGFGATGASVSSALTEFNYIVSPPTIVEHKTDICVSGLTVCNKTGRWTPEGEEGSLIAEACSTFTVPHASRYSNIYCKVCQPVEVKKNEACDVRDDHRIDGSQFTVILKNRGDTEQNEAETSSDAGLCPGNTIMDVYTRSCRRLFCPQFQELVKGRCESFVENYSNVLVLMVLELMADDFPSFMKESKQSKVAAARRYMSFLTDDRVDMAFTLRDVAETPEEFPDTPYLAVVASVSTRAVPEANILQWLYDRLAKSFSYSAPAGRTFTFSGSLSVRIHVGYIKREFNVYDERLDPALTDQPANSTLVSLYHKTVVTQERIYGELFTHILLCPRVKLNKSEYEDFGNYIVVRATNTTLYFLQYAPVFSEKLRGDNVLICVEDYLPGSQSDRGELAPTKPQLEAIVLLAAMALLVVASGAVVLAICCLRPRAPLEP